MPVESVLINCHYPVTPTSFMLQWGVIVRRPPGLTDAQAARFGAKFAKFVGVGFEQDVQIWLHKSRVDNPLLCAEDGPVYQLRRWYEQFYTDVADIEPDMVARYEFEIDTSQAGGGLGGGGRRRTSPPGGPMPADERRASRRPVRCARCGAAVLVAKFSPQHTSVQWTAAAAASCAEFRAVGRRQERPRAARGLRRPAGQHRRRGGGRAAGGRPALV